MISMNAQLLIIRNFFTEKLAKFLPGFEEKAPALLPYFSTLYFVEVIYFMFMLLLIYGRTAAVLCGFILALLLTFHVIGLFFMKNRYRKIQLILMDIHIAFTVGFLINRIAGDISLSSMDEFMMVFRGLTALLEIPLVFIFTSDYTIKKYS